MLEFIKMVSQHGFALVLVLSIWAFLSLFPNTEEKTKKKVEEPTREVDDVTISQINKDQEL